MVLTLGSPGPNSGGGFGSVGSRVRRRVPLGPLAGRSQLQRQRSDRGLLDLARKPNRPSYRHTTRIVILPVDGEPIVAVMHERPAIAVRSRAAATAAVEDQVRRDAVDPAALQFDVWVGESDV
jgi:hypothetical protein